MVYNQYFDFRKKNCYVSKHIRIVKFLHNEAEVQKIAHIAPVKMVIGN